MSYPQLALQGHNATTPTKPIIRLVPGGAAYLWIGNNADGDQQCFATVSGARRLRRFAKAILEEVGEK